MILEDLPEQLFNDRGRLAAVAAVSVVAWALAIHLFFSPHAAFWRSCSWVGLRHKLFPKARAGLDAIRNTRGLVEKGYKQVSVHKLFLPLLYDADTVHSSQRTTFHLYCPSLATLIW